MKLKQTYGILAALTLVCSAGISTVACSQTHAGEPKVKKINLVNKLIISDLGEFEHPPTKLELLDRLKAENP